MIDNIALVSHLISVFFSFLRFRFASYATHANLLLIDCDRKLSKPVFVLCVLLIHEYRVNCANCCFLIFATKIIFPFPFSSILAQWHSVSRGLVAQWTSNPFSKSFHRFSDQYREQFSSYSFLKRLVEFSLLIQESRKTFLMFLFRFRNASKNVFSARWGSKLSAKYPAYFSAYLNCRYPCHVVIGYCVSIFIPRQDIAIVIPSPRTISSDSISLPTQWKQHHQ